MLEAHSQAFVPSPFFRSIEPSPTESLAFHVSGALLALGLKFFDLKDTVAEGVWAFATSCAKAIDTVVFQVGDPENPTMGDAVRTATIALALLGFLDAASAQADFWKAESRLGLIQKLKQLLSVPFLVALETALSTIRHSHGHDREVKEWKRILRHYSSSGRPLGAMLLQRSFMWLVLSSAALMVADGPTLRANHVLDLLMSGAGDGPSELDDFFDSDLRSIETFTGLAVEQMEYIEADADFVRLGSPTQQKLAFAIKSAAMMTFLVCSLLNDQVADTDVLMNWLQETLEDPTQMADDALASVVLRCLALICRIAPVFSPTVIRVLPRFLVQSAPRGDTVGVASRSLAFVLKTVSEDAVISSLYSLGNVLSPVSDGVSANDKTNGTAGGDGVAGSIYASRHSTGSSISLQINGEEETAVAYGNVVQVICGIAAACQDDKITALAQSMLLQKVNKVSADVDAHVISGAATLALMGGQLEFRALLKMYSRMCHIGIVENKDFLLAAVRAQPRAAFIRLLMRFTGHEGQDTLFGQPEARLATL